MQVLNLMVNGNLIVEYSARLNQKDGNDGKDIYIYDKKAKGLKPFLEGKNIERYYYSQDGWLDYKPKEHYNSMFKELFESEKIMLINVVKDICRFAYDDKGLYNSHTVINCVRYVKLDKAEHISPKNAINEIDLEYSQLFEYKSVLAILNSKLLNWYFYNFLSEGIHFYPNDVNLPITKNIANNIILNILDDEIIKYTNEFYFIHNIFINLLSKEFTGINITRKIKDYHRLTFIEFETELKKQKIELGLFKDKLKNQFETSKLKIVDILDIINKTENQINKLAYELNELTEEKIKIIEDS